MPPIPHYYYYSNSCQHCFSLLQNVSASKFTSPYLWQQCKNICCVKENLRSCIFSSVSWCFRWASEPGQFEPNLNRAVRLNPQMSRSCQFKIWSKWDLDLDRDEGEAVEADEEEDDDATVDTLRACDNGMVGGVWPKIDSHCDKEGGRVAFTGICLFIRDGRGRKFLGQGGANQLIQRQRVFGGGQQIYDPGGLQSILWKYKHQHLIYLTVSEWVR